MGSVFVTDEAFATEVPLVIVGAGAAGLCAALAAKEAGEARWQAIRLGRPGTVLHLNQPRRHAAPKRAD